MEEKGFAPEPPSGPPEGPPPAPPTGAPSLSDISIRVSRVGEDVVLRISRPAGERQEIILDPILARHLARRIIELAESILGGGSKE